METRQADRAISVAMCTYNGARFLAAQLDSIAQQTAPPCELVICDDGSTDRTPQIVAFFQRRAPFPVRFMRNSKRLGVTHNFARCISHCRGDLIALSDQDDLWHASKLDTIGRLFDTDPNITAVFSNASLMDESGHPLPSDAWSRFLFTPELQQQMLSGDAAGVLLKVPVVTGGALMFRASLRQRALPIPHDWIHDAWLAWVAALSGRLVPVNNPLLEYRLHGDQVLGLSVESGHDRLKRLGMKQWLRREHQQAERQFRHMHTTYAELAAFVETHRLGTLEIRSAIRRKSEFAARVSALLEKPRFLRAVPSAALVRDYARFTPLGPETIVRHAVI